MLLVIKIKLSKLKFIPNFKYTNIGFILTAVYYNTQKQMFAKKKEKNLNINTKKKHSWQVYSHNITWCEENVKPTVL